MTAGRRRPGARVLPASALRFIPATKQPIDAICPISPPSHVIPRRGIVDSNGAGLANDHVCSMFLARALSSWSQELEMKMKMDLRLNEENWVALAACVTLAVSVLIRLAAT